MDTEKHKNLQRPFGYHPPSDLEVEIVYADDDLLIVNKPSGLLSVPGKAAEHKTCLASLVQKKYPEALIIHRLDMDTSGVMVMARNKAAHRYLSIAFEKRRPRKSYIACVWGEIKQAEGRVDLPLICDWPNRPLQMVDYERGKPSITHWEVIGQATLKSGDKVSRVKLTPETGRSHQLRVHMLSLGHPIIGDRFYAHDRAYLAASRLQLHAHSLTIYHPKDDKKMAFEVACPF